MEQSMKEYHLNSRLVTLFSVGVAAGLFGFILALWSVLNHFNKNELITLDMLLSIFEVLFFAYAAYYFANIALKSRLIISSEGLTYKSFSTDWTAKWSGELSFGTLQRPFFKIEGIYVPYQMKGRRFIPLSQFADNWRTSELGGQIKQHAPHLFEQENIIRVNPWQNN
jgi:hypothetical protein